MFDSFLTAEWRKLIMANYAVSPNILQKYAPKYTELDFFHGVCYVSLVGFLFDNVRLKGIPVPFHTSFEEVNLRFYVRYLSPEHEWKRGTTFIKEIVPKPAVSWVANTIFHERYTTMPMRHSIKHNERELAVNYEWKDKNWHSLAVSAKPQLSVIEAGSEEEFITEHYWGYTQFAPNVTSEYGVEHPRWEVYPIVSHEIKVNFEELYGSDFAFLNQQSPLSVLMAEGSAITVKSARKF